MHLIENTRMRFLIPLSLTLLACNDLRRSPQLIQTQDFVLIDTAYNPSPEYTTASEEAYCPIYYKGKPRDTIHIGEPFGRKLPGETDQDIATFRYTSSSLKISVDTTAKVMVAEGYWNKERTGYERVVNYQAYVVTLHNTGDSITYLGSPPALWHAFREAKTASGQWIRLKDPLSGACSTGLGALYLKPGEIILAKVPLHINGMPTECRIVWGSEYRGYIYSNIYTDQITHADFFGHPFEAKLLSFSLDTKAVSSNPHE